MVRTRPAPEGVGKVRALDEVPMTLRERCGQTCAESSVDNCFRDQAVTNA
jgi:hypothetical protein